MRLIGLTGSIGMGKSATAELFRAEGVPVHDSDAAVHRLYAGSAVAAIEQAFPGVTVDGRIDRSRLARCVLGRPEQIARLESIVHPLVEQDRKAFVDEVTEHGARLAVLDIPLLFEIGGEHLVDVIVVVSAPADVQKARVLARPGMTVDKLVAILARQLDDAEKRRRAHIVIETHRGIDDARRQIRAFLRALSPV